MPNLCLGMGIETVAGAADGSDLQNLGAAVRRTRETPQ
jgi:hypothetical protein